jgi:prepilin-type N-terminal cleavage/methylation domain-containing protein
MRTTKREQRGFSLIELMIVVAIMLIIAAVAIPSLVQSKAKANEASAVASMDAIKTAQTMYMSNYPQAGYAASLSQLGGTAAQCATPTNAAACLIDSSLSGASAPPGKSGYIFTVTGGGAQGGVNTNYYATAAPLVLNRTGFKSFCITDDGVKRVDPTGGAIGSYAACQALNPLNQ